MAQEEAFVLSDIIVTAPKQDGPCRIRREKQTDNNEARRGSSIAASMRALNLAIQSETDCTALQQKVKMALNGIKEDILSGTSEIARKLEEILPILSLPLNPFKIPKWLKKFVIGRILPDLDATIDLILRVVEVTNALTELIKTINNVLPRLEACAISTRDMIRSDIENEIERTLLDIKDSIEDAIAEAICNGINSAGISANDIGDILTGLSAVNAMVDSIDQFKMTIDVVLNDNISKVGSSQALIESITGIPPVIDTTSINSFVETTSSEAYTDYRNEVQSVLLLPEPVNTVLPTISGTAAVGETLECSNGVWTANGVVTNFDLSFQWMRQGQDIYGANTYQYIPSVDDIDYPIYCKVVAENQTNIEEAFTANTSPVVFAMSEANRPAISGIAQSGFILTCSTGTWPFTPTTITYEWIRVPSVGANVVVKNASSSNQYLVSSTDDDGNDKTIKCRVVAQSFRYTLAIDTANTAIVVP